MLWATFSAPCRQIVRTGVRFHCFKVPKYLPRIVDFHRNNLIRAKVAVANVFHSPILQFKCPSGRLERLLGASGSWLRVSRFKAVTTPYKAHRYFYGSDEPSKVF